MGGLLLIIGECGGRGGFYSIFSVELALVLKGKGRIGSCVRSYCQTEWRELVQ